MEKPWQVSIHRALSNGKEYYGMDLFPRGFSGAVPHKDFATIQDVVDQLEMFGFDRDAVQFVKDSLDIKGEFQSVDAFVNTEAAIAFGWPKHLLP